MEPGDASNAPTPPESFASSSSEEEEEEPAEKPEPEPIAPVGKKKKPSSNRIVLHWTKTFSHQLPLFYFSQLILIKSYSAL